MSLQERLKKAVAGRNKAIKDARDILERAEGEKRELLAEEDEQYKRAMSDMHRFGDERDSIKALLDAEERDAQFEKPHDMPTGPPDPPQEERTVDENGQPFHYTTRDEYRDAYSRWLSTGSRDAEDELRALAVGSATQAGNLVASEKFSRQLVKNLDSAVYMRQWCTVENVRGAQTLGVPTLTTDVADAAWTTEIQAAPEDSALAVGKRSLTPRYLAKLEKVSRPLLRNATINGGVEGLVAERLTYKLSIAQENAFFNGNGTDAPLGVFDVAATGFIPTTRDKAAASATALVADDFIKAKFHLKNPYWRSAKWVFNQIVVEEIAKLKNSQGYYIWRESMRDGEPEKLLNIPVAYSDFIPSTLTTGLYVGVLADFKRGYIIAQDLNIETQRLDELYAATNQVGFVARAAIDGQPQLPEAFVRLKMG